MTTAGRRVRLAPEARRAQLIDLGVEMLATRTLDELPVEAIAAQAGISRGLLFHYFGSKQEFYVEVARAAADEMIRRTDPDPELPPVAALRSALGAYVDYVVENPDNYTSLVRGAASGDAAMRAIFDQTRAAMAGRVLAVLEVLGLPPSQATALTVHGWVAYAEEVVVRWLAGSTATGAGDATTDGSSPSRDDLVDLLARALPALVMTATGTPSAAVRAVADELSATGRGLRERS